MAADVGPGRSAEREPGPDGTEDVQAMQSEPDSPIHGGAHDLAWAPVLRCVHAAGEEGTEEAGEREEVPEVTTWKFDWELFARMLKAKRVTAKLTLREMDAHGISAATTMRMEQGKAADLDSVVAACEFMGLMVDAFVIRPDQPSGQIVKEWKPEGIEAT